MPLVRIEIIKGKTTDYKKKVLDAVYEGLVNYQRDYHVIVPILPGHNPKQKEEFLSFQETAREKEEYYIARYGNEVYAVYGMSMGGVLTAILWQNKRLKFEKVIFDGSPLVSYHKLMKKMMTKFYLDITRKTQQRDRKTVEQAKDTIIAERHLDDFLSVLDHMSDTTIVNCLNGIGDYKLPLNIDTPDTKVYYFHGTKINEMLAKKTAKYISKNYPNATIRCFKGKGHCENALMNPEIMIRELGL